MEFNRITGGVSISSIPLKRFNQLQGSNEAVIQQENIQDPTPQQIAEVIDGANHFFNTINTHVQFHIHEELNTFYVEIRNSSNNEVIREVPPKKFLDMMAKLQELAGIIIDEKV